MKFFKSWRDKRREKILGYVARAAEDYCRLKDFSYTVRQDPEHQKDIEERATAAETELRKYCRILSEFDFGLEVELPGEGGW